MISWPAPPKPSCMRPTIFASATRTDSVSYFDFDWPASVSDGFSASLRTMSIIDSMGRTTILVTSREKRKNIVVRRSARKIVFTMLCSPPDRVTSLTSNAAMLVWL